MRIAAKGLLGLIILIAVLVVFAVIIPTLIVVIGIVVLAGVAVGAIARLLIKHPKKARAKRQNSKVIDVEFKVK